MMAVEQKNKVRVIMNLSAPTGASLNKAVYYLTLGKVSISTAKTFGYSVVDRGPAACMWEWTSWTHTKTSQPPSRTSASKPSPGWAWGLQKLKKVCGDSSSVTAFDRLGNTLASHATIISGLPPQLVHCTLDDTPVVTPAK
jgi:hypothetical protein